MKTAFIENEFDIGLGVSFFLDKPILKKEWLSLILYFDEIISLLPGQRYEKYKLITFRPYPLLEIVNRKFKQKTPEEPETLELNIIDYCVDNNSLYIKPLPHSDRDEFLFNIENKIPNSLELLKKSFFTVDLINFFISNYLSNIGQIFESDLLFELADFKKSELGNSFQEGIEFLLEKYSSYYYLTPPVESEIKDLFLREQNELFKKTNIEKINTFDFSVLLEDGLGTLGSLIIPILPISTIKELHKYFKNSIEFEKDKFLLFVLSIFYIQKIISKYSNEKKEEPKCKICATTVSEINKLTEEQCHYFIFQYSQSFCYNHMISYLENRKVNRLTGKALLINLKKNNNIVI